MPTVTFRMTTSVLVMARRCIATGMLAALPLLAQPVSSADVRIERATYNSGGALTGLLYDHTELPVAAAFVAEFQGGLRFNLQPHDQRSPITRDGARLSWSGSSTFPNTSQARYTAAWREDDAGVHFEGAAHAGPAPGDAAGRAAATLDLKTLEYVIDVPRSVFSGGTLQPGAASLSPAKPADVVFFRQTTDRLRFTDAQGNVTLGLTFAQARPVTVTDHWDREGRFYRVRVLLHEGAWRHDQPATFAMSFQPAGKARTAPAAITVSPARTRYPFHGFGGNYCFGNSSPVTAYTLEHLPLAWGRCELKATAWDRALEQHRTASPAGEGGRPQPVFRGEPSPDLQRDFEVMRTFQQRGIPWILSLWRLPERYYADANQKAPGSFGRQIAAERWPEFVALVGSFITHVKETYGAEPDMFSFNEPDLGVDLGFTPETHRDTIKKLGAEFRRLGLKTKLLLGDTANPRDTHRYVLATAADRDAMQYVAAVSFHSWGNGTPEQYRAWADVAEWLGLPLLVGEAGVDPGAYRNLAYDSYAYGLREAAQYQDLLRHARPQSLLYWEYTSDYGLARVAADGSVQPTGRFWLMKQFSDLTPAGSQGIDTESNQKDALVSGFVHGSKLIVHVLNTAASRSATVRGLPAGKYRVVTTTETAGLKTGGELSVGTAEATLPLPARSLVTLVSESPTAADSAGQPRSGG